MRKTVVIMVALLFSLMQEPAWTGEMAPVKPASPYTVTVVPFYGPEKLWSLYSPFVNYLKKTTGQPWELKLYHDHDAVIQALCEGEVSVAFLGPVPIGRVNKKCGGVPVLVALGMDGKPFYRSVILTNEMDAVDLKSVRGKKLGLFKGSTAAHILPLKMLKDAGIGVDAVQPVFFEGQDRIMTALLTREVKAAGVKDALYLKFKNEQIKLLKTSELLPNFAVCASPKVKPAVLAQFKRQLLRLKPATNLRDARTVKDWDDEIKNGFILPDADYLPSVMRVHGIYEEIMHEGR